MSLQLDDVFRIARLARLEINAGEAEATLVQLNNVFGLIETMQAAPTDNIEPMAHAQDVAQRLRADVVSESDHRTAYQSIAPETEAGLYLVPRVVE